MEHHDDDDAPSGLREGELEENPLGPPEADPDHDAPPERGPGAMPGIPSEGEPPTSG
jgi:hypothetical protein